MTLPQGFNHKQGRMQVCRLLKSPYGHKQAYRQWNIHLTIALLSFGFVQSHLDYSFFTKQLNEKIIVILIYVDDLLITGEDTSLIQTIKDYMQQRLKIKETI